MSDYGSLSEQSTQGQSSQDVVMLHGCNTHRAETIPDVGPSFSNDSIGISLWPANPFEFHFASNNDFICMPFGKVDLNCAFDSDQSNDFSSRAGDLYFHPSGSTTRVKNLDTPNEVLIIEVGPHFRDEIAQEMNSSNALQDIGGVIAQLSSDCSLPLAQKARRFLLNGNEGGTLVCQSIALSLLSEALDAVVKQRQNSKRDRGLNARALNIVLDYIEVSLDEDLSLNTLAALAGLTTFHFARAFKKATGQSPRQYVLERRMARARTCLETTDLSLAEIAYSSGFSSQAHMTDVFRRRLGITPGKYKTQKLF